MLDITGYVIYWIPSNYKLRKFILMSDDQVLAKGQVQVLQENCWTDGALHLNRKRLKRFPLYVERKRRRNTIKIISNGIKIRENFSVN
jgi:hypothetical protein